MPAADEALTLLEANEAASQLAAQPASKWDLGEIDKRVTAMGEDFHARLTEVEENFPALAQEIDAKLSEVLIAISSFTKRLTTLEQTPKFEVKTEADLVRHPVTGFPVDIGTLPTKEMQVQTGTDRQPISNRPAFLRPTRLTG